MDTQEVSAFAAYAQKKQKKRDKSKSLKKKLKLKEKAKRKATENNQNSIMETLVDVTESTTSTSDNLKKKHKKKHNDNDNDFVRLKAHKESIFKDCAVTTKVDNLFLNENEPQPKNTRSKKLKKSMEDISKIKSKKIKYMNGADLESSDTESNSESSENSIYIDEVPTVTSKPGSLFEKDDLNQNVGSDKAKNNLNGMDGSKKINKKKIMNGDHIKNSGVNKNNVNADQKFLLKNKQANIQLKHAVVRIEPLNLKNKSWLKQSNEASNLEKIIYSDSAKVGEEVFSWMLSPVSVKDFFKNSWEQKPLLIQHNNKDYFKQICTLDDFKKALRSHDMYFTRNIDVTSYIDGERHTENPEGKAKPSVVWDFYRNGRSIRLLNPQTFINNVRVLNTTLQEFFHCFVGANIYLTPPGTQGFAPHYDDIEAFVLQLEGEKHWKLYNPRSPEEVLPRESSRNFREDEIGEPILEVTLQPGDLLYFPRGIIHQAKCLPHVHSLHITVSCYQRNSWADLLEKVIPVALQKAISEDVEFRKGLPLGYLDCLGLSHSEQTSDHRQEMIKKFEGLVQKIVEYCPLDAGVDQLAADYIHDALPPCLTEVEEVHGADRNCKMENENLLNALKNFSDKNLRVKLIRATCVRLVSEEGELFLYYTTDNSLVYHEHDVLSVGISPQWAQAIDYLIHSYPKFVEMKELPVSEKINKPGHKLIHSPSSGIWKCIRMPTFSFCVLNSGITTVQVHGDAETRVTRVGCRVWKDCNIFPAATVDEAHLSKTSGRSERGRVQK